MYIRGGENKNWDDILLLPSFMFCVGQSKHKRMGLLFIHQF